nr:PREDICTED: DNA topoisomerase 1-like [Bemisia tabaci]
MKSSQTESLYHIGACEDDSGREEITIIPTNWIFAKGFCVWPTKAPNKNTSKLICKRIDHQATDYGWIECRYRPLYTEIYSYEDALKYEREAIETSDIGTPENPTRKKFAPNRLISSSSDDEDSPYPVIPDSLKGTKLKGSVKQNLFPQLNDASLTSNDDATEIVENEHLERTPKRRAEKVLSPPKSTKKTKISKVNHVAKEDDSMLETKTSGPSAKEMSQPGVEKKTAPLISDKDATMRVAKKRVEKELTPLKPMRKTKFSKVNHVAEEDDSILETETSGPSVKETSQPAIEKKTAPLISDKDATMRVAKKRVEKELTPLKPMRKTKFSKVNHVAEEDDSLLETETSGPSVKEIPRPAVEKRTAPSTSDKDATMRTAKKRVEKELTPLKPMRKTKISKVNHATEEDDFLLEN